MSRDVSSRRRFLTLGLSAGAALAGGLAGCRDSKKPPSQPDGGGAAAKKAAGPAAAPGVQTPAEPPAGVATVAIALNAQQYLEGAPAFAYYDEPTALTALAPPQGPPAGATRLCWSVEAGPPPPPSAAQ